MTYYVKTLQTELERRKSKNQAYTLRTFANFLDIDSGSLSAILNKKRPFPLSKIDSICENLKLDEDEKDKFLKSVINFKSTQETIKSKKPLVKEIKLNEKDSYDFIADWKYSAILSICKIKDPNLTVENIAKRLNLREEETELMIDQLRNWGFIESYIFNDKDKVIRLTTTEDIESNALKTSHISGLDMAKDKLTTIDPSLRDISSLTLPINTKKIPKAKKLIRKFRKDLNLLLEDGKEDQVYYLGVQLFPMSEL